MKSKANSPLLQMQLGDQDSIWGPNGEGGHHILEYRKGRTGLRSGEKR